MSLIFAEQSDFAMDIINCPMTVLSPSKKDAKGAIIITVSFYFLFRYILCRYLQTYLGIEYFK